MNYKLEAIEILENGVFIGYTPIIQFEGQRKQGYIGEDGKPILFDTARKARVYAMKQEFTFETT